MLSPEMISTERLRVRKMECGDAPFMLDLLNDPGFLKFIGDRQVRNAASAETYIEEKIIQSYRTNDFGLYLVLLANPSIPIGICGLVKRESLPLPDLGFAFLNSHCRKGFGFESAKAVLDFEQTRLSLSKILAITVPGNIASEKLLRKLGFQLERTEPLTANADPSLVFALKYL